MAGRAPVQTLTVESRKLDDTLAQMLTTARPLIRAPFRSDQMESNMALWERAAHYARNLVAATRAVPALEPAARQQLTAALDGELQKVSSLAATISGRGANAAGPGRSRIRSIYLVSPTTAATAARTHAPSSGVRSPSSTERWASSPPTSRARWQTDSLPSS